MRQIHTAGAACAAKESMATAAAATVMVATADDEDKEASGGQEGVQQQRMSMPAEVRDMHDIYNIYITVDTRGVSIGMDDTLALAHSSGSAENNLS